MAVLDGDKMFSSKIRLEVGDYNRKSPNWIKLNSYTNLVDFLLNFDHDIALIDLSINGVNGFKVAEKILRQKRNAVVFIMSHLFMSDEEDESLLCKMNLKISEIIERYSILKYKEVRNVRQIVSGDRRFKDVAGC